MANWTTASSSYYQECREKNTAKALANLPAELKIKVESFYELKGFPKNFRQSIDSVIADSLDWAGYDSKTLQCRLSQVIKTRLPDFWVHFQKKEGMYTMAFKECYDKELAEYTSKVKKPATGKRKRPSGQQTVPISGQITFADLSSKPNSELVQRLCVHVGMFAPIKETVESHNSGKLPDAANELRKALESAVTVGQQTVKLFRACINECREKQARFALSVDEQGESADIQALDQDINHIELQAQTFVRLMYDFIIFAQGAVNLANMFKAFIRDVTQITFFVSRVTQQQTIKDNVNFNASVRLLTLPALRSLSSADFSQTVQITYAVVHEENVERLLRDTSILPIEAATFAIDFKGKSSKNTKVFSAKWKHLRYPKVEDSKCHFEQVTVEFENLKIEKMKSSDEEPKTKQKKKSSQLKKMPAETEKKTVILFTAFIRFTDGAELAIRTYSNVQVLITHVKQKCPAWRTLIWHNAFYSPNIQIPTEVKWERFIYALNTWFFARTGAPLRPEHVEFIRQCICVDDKVKYSSLWDEPDKECRSPIRLQFWPFFFKCTMAIAEVDQLRTLWKSNLLYGFVSNDDACTLLGQYPGNALIRFSNTKKRGAIVVMLSRQFSLEEVRVCSLAPITLKKNSNELFESLFDIEVEVIYPNADWKSIVDFTHESTSIVEGSNQTPYVKTVNKLVVPDVREWPVTIPRGRETPALPEELNWLGTTPNGLQTPSSGSDDGTTTDDLTSNGVLRSEIESCLGDMTLDNSDNFSNDFSPNYWTDAQQVDG